MSVGAVVHQVRYGYKGPGPRSIKLCNYAASQASDLKRHVMIVHEKVKNFKCDLCEYATSWAKQLKNHVMAVHENVKNFKCDLCEYATSYANHLKNQGTAVHDLQEGLQFGWKSSRACEKGSLQNQEPCLSDMRS